MKIKTLRFGELDVSESDVYEIPDGLLGFPEHKRYARVALDNVKPLILLQSCEDSSLAFILCDPKLFFADYEPVLKSEDRKKLDMARPQDMEILVTMTFHARKEETTANLKGPLIFNRAGKLAAQIVLEDARYSTKHKVFK